MKTKIAPVSTSYMELCIHVDGGANLYLRVPTVWDDADKMWRGFLKTPKSQKLIHGCGKDSFDLQNSFNRALKEVFDKEDEISKELFSMFQPISYWEEMEE